MTARCIIHLDDFIVLALVVMLEIVSVLRFAWIHGLGDYSMIQADSNTLDPHDVA
jgi:hypothetical protein